MNPRSSSSESDVLTTRLPSHPIKYVTTFLLFVYMSVCLCVCVCVCLCRPTWRDKYDSDDNKSTDDKNHK